MTLGIKQERHEQLDNNIKDFHSIQDCVTFLINESNQLEQDTISQNLQMQLFEIYLYFQENKSEAVTFNNLRKALNEKVGITFDEVTTAKHANFFNTINDWDDVELNRVQKNVEYGYSIFLDRVATGRKMDSAAVNKIARGRVWTGQDAVSIGLVDELGGLELAIQRVKEIAKIKEAEVVNFPKEKTMFESIKDDIFGSDEKSDEAAMLKNLTPQVLYMKQVERIKSLGVLQYKIPYDLSVK